MRISYWSSDECSSALSSSHPRPPWPPWPRTERGRQMAPQGGAGRVQWLQRSVGLAIVGTVALGESALQLPVAAGAPERSAGRRAGSEGGSRGSSGSSPNQTKKKNTRTNYIKVK